MSDTTDQVPDAPPLPVKAGPKKVNWWYERLADWLIANPDKTLTEAALIFDVSLSWLSTVKNSDTFQEFWRERSRAFSDAVITDVKAKAYAATDMALDHLNQRLATQGAAMPTNQLLDIVDVNMKRFGAYGADKNSGGPVPIKGFVGIVSAEELANARKLIRRTPDTDVVDAEVISEG